MSQFTELIIYACTLANLCIGLVYKVPQILLLQKTQSTQGISYITATGDVIANLIYILYNVYFSYELVAYSDYCLYFLQSLVIFIQMHYFDQKLSTCAVTLLLIVSALYAGYHSSLIMTNCIFACTFFSLFGKVVQIRKIQTAPSVKSLSLPFWILSLSSSAIKLIQVSLASVLDPKLVGHCVLSTLCSTILVSLLYRRKQSDKHKSD